jgi:hypothetical protein
MKNILIIDSTYPKGHREINKSLIDAISKKNNVFLAEYKSYFSNVNNCTRVKIRKQYLPNNIKFLVIIAHIINALMIRKKTKNIDFDKIVFLSINELTFYYVSKVFRKKQIYVVHHNDIDKILKSPKKYSYLKNAKIRHLVFADFIKTEMIRSLDISGDNITEINHPIPSTSHSMPAALKETESKIFLGIGLSNDEDIISKLIELDKTGYTFKKNIKLIMRSSCVEYRGKWLEIFQGFLSNSEYMKLYEKSFAVILTYPQSFKYRYSGSFINAMMLKKKVIFSNILLGKYLHNIYPNNCKIYTDFDSFLKLLNNIDGEFDFNEFNRFIELHSLKTVENQINSSLKDNN